MYIQYTNIGNPFQSQVQQLLKLSKIHTYIHTLIAIPPIYPPTYIQYKYKICNTDPTSTVYQGKIKIKNSVVHFLSIRRIHSVCM